MNSLSRTLIISTLAAMSLSLGACSNMSEQHKDATIGAVAGGVAGSVLTGGSTAGTVGGALVGGVIGNEVGKRK